MGTKLYFNLMHFGLLKEHGKIVKKKEELENILIGRLDSINKQETIDAEKDQEA